MSERIRIISNTLADACPVDNLRGEKKLEFTS